MLKKVARDINTKVFPGMLVRLIAVLIMLGGALPLIISGRILLSLIFIAVMLLGTAYFIQRENSR
jgi:hypothetical protein